MARTVFLAGNDEALVQFNIPLLIVLISLLHRLVRKRYRSLGLQSHRMELPDCSLHYYTFTHPTSSTTLLLLHGLGTSSSTWLWVMPSLIRVGSVVAVDLPGFGFSHLSPLRPYVPFPRQLQTVKEVIERLKLRRVTVVGHSLGGWIATRLALELPEWIERLVLINPAGVYYKGAEELRNLFRLQSQDDVRRLLDRLWHHVPWFFKPFRGVIRHELVRRHVADFAASVELTELIPVCLSALTMPVTILWGREDRLLSEQTVRLLQARIPHARVYYIEESGHVPQLEQPRATQRLLESIMAGKNDELAG